MNEKSSKLDPIPISDAAILEELSFFTQLRANLPGEWQGIDFLTFHLRPIEEMQFSQVDQPTLILQLNAVTHLEWKGDDAQGQGMAYPGGICLEPKGSVVGYHWHSSITNCWVTFEPAWLASLIDGLVFGDPYRLEVLSKFNFHDPLLYQLGVALDRELQAGGLAGNLFAESLGQTLVLHLVRHYSSFSTFKGGKRSAGWHTLTPQQLRSVTDYLQDHLQQKVSLPELATTIGLSQAHFSRLFKETTGLAPHQYLIRLRVERAKELLLEGKLGLAEIAIKVGFVDQSHLNHHFKHCFGVLPSTLQKRKTSRNFPE